MIPIGTVTNSTPRTPKSTARCDVLWAALLDQLDRADALAAAGDSVGASATRAEADVLRDAWRRA